ncbi:hypothetical protein [Paraglaciecola sp. L1A13]|uniref:hypothetical protein n=1 Tax=Paraglaciecola sp. L1A13 TaxID=2686359 RepID=UPI00131DA31B|nr:hypothetical protein [Paraglaciecola sp. L1A13]|tara:strand:- start:10675 stop:12570 length:1896 start_codon:yes stop_codon:yes gene_type:complete
MAYDFGTNTLGISNPFKPEGAAKALSGLAVVVLGVIALLGVADDLKNDMVLAWVNALLGLTLLTLGLRHAGIGLFQLFKYFVGRSVPTSLAYNHNSSEKQNAERERFQTAYDAQELESMLMGRKNATFTEPEGWIARLIHTLVPRLIFSPYPIRNFVQELGGLVCATVVGLIAFGAAYFVSASGLVGNAGVIITPILSVLLLVYLIAQWRSTSHSLAAPNMRKLQAKTAASLAKLLVFAIVVPIAIGFVYSQLNSRLAEQVQQVLTDVVAFDAWWNLLLLIVMVFAVIGLSWVMVKERLALANPSTEVSEFRENLQESVHPNEIFINIENIVLANRRYKEIPNRMYQEFDPKLQEQSQGKGSFKGKLLIETQPEFSQLNYSAKFNAFRLLATISAQILVFAGALLLFFTVQEGYQLYQFIAQQLFNLEGMSQVRVDAILHDFGLQLSGFLVLLFSWLTVAAGATILARGTNLFWAEMQFSSLLMWMKTEGTFTESKVSTGMSIHDSTRSENVVVRSSITPWIITSRVMTSTFATTGTKNLEMPRYVMQMDKNNQELQGIVGEITQFLRKREAIASITNEQDLSSAENIYRVNEASRAKSDVLIGENATSEKQKLEEQAAGKLRQDELNASS